jgi:phage tail-like protein
VIDGGGAQLSFLRYIVINNRNAGIQYSGTYVSLPVNSTDEKNRWHRFLLEGDFLPGTQVEFYYSVLDNPADVSFSWHKGLPDSSAQQGTEQRDGLFQEAIEGQYLRFKIVLTANEQHSPVVRSVSLFFPRSTWLEYLPPIYQNDPVSRAFLERFLSLFESSYSETDFCIEHMSRFLDVSGTPAKFLDWLGSWLALPSDENWTAEHKRLLISRAMELYRKRGTREGLEETIALFTGCRPWIIESIVRAGSASCELISDTGDERHLYFPSDDTFVDRPVYLFEWDEIPGTDRQKLISYLKAKYPSDPSLETAIIVKGKNPVCNNIPGNCIKLTLVPDTTKPEKVTISRTSDGISYSMDIPVTTSGCRILVLDPERPGAGSVPLRDLLFGDLSEVPLKEKFRFCVLLRNDPPIDDTTLNTIRNIIADQKPAHTRSGLTVLEPWFYLDMHTYLGVNTKLSTQAFILGSQSVLSRDTMISDDEGSGQLKTHARIGIDVKLT